MISQTIEIMNSTPKIIIIVVLAAVVQQTSVGVLIWIIGLTSWTGIARIMRAETLKCKEKFFIESATAMGIKDSMILLKYILPNTIKPILVIISFGVGSVVLIESSLSFLGIGVSRDTITLGKIIAYGQNNIDNWELTLLPGFAIFVIVYGLNIIAKLPAIAAAVYRLRFNKGERIESNNDLDWSGNFLHMMGFDQSKDMLKMMQLYLMLHCDHEGGNVSTFSSLTVNSALSDPYYSLSAGLNGLAGPLHGLANQNNLKFVLEVVEHFKGVPSDKELKEFVWDRLNSGRVIPGYGHAVLRCPDPRFTAFMGFGNKHIKDCDVFSVVTKLFNIVPDILKQHGKAKNPWPNVDAASGSLLYHYGLKEFEFYTVLFSMSRSLGIVSQMVLSRAMGLPLTRPKSLTFDALNKL